MIHRRMMMREGQTEKPWKYVGNQRNTKYTTFTDGTSLVNATEWKISGTISDGYIQFFFPKAGQWQVVRIYKDDNNNSFTEGYLDIVITFQSPDKYYVNGYAGDYEMVNKEYTLSSGSYGGFQYTRGGSQQGYVDIYGR